MMRNLVDYIKNIFETHAHWKEIKNFHPEGKREPNGVGLQRGGYFNECRVNSNAFRLDEGVHGEQYGLKNYCGGVIIFSTDVNAIQLSDNKVVNKIKQIIKTYSQRFRSDSKIEKVIKMHNASNDEFIGAFSIGKAFKGRYVSDNGKIFDEHSISVEINGLSSRGLLNVAELIAKEFMQETVLVKDLNTNKIYLADDVPSAPDKPVEYEMLSRINKECENNIGHAY